ncbi:MAG: dihydroorotate dehydrogenase, partial [Muribaculaceae bacterium]|nr:dihydroorotate dehydrogenase [Muribaculaceae bacterium]
MVNLRTHIGGGLEIQNPILTASGTFGYGEEYSSFIDLNRLGGFIVKGTTFEPRQGNDYPRMVETPSGMLNAVGLQNKGVKHFVDEIYPRLCDYKSEIIVNISGASIDDYVAVAQMLDPLPRIKAI